jgi:hypothetical protein
MKKLENASLVLLLLHVVIMMVEPVGKILTSLFMNS